jgi:hypothetical protein
MASHITDRAPDANPMSQIAAPIRPALEGRPMKRTVKPDPAPYHWWSWLASIATSPPPPPPPQERKSPCR